MSIVKCCDVHWHDLNERPLEYSTYDRLKASLCLCIILDAAGNAMSITAVSFCQFLSKAHRLDGLVLALASVPWPTNEWTNAYFFKTNRAFLFFVVR